MIFTKKKSKKITQKVRIVKYNSIGDSNSNKNTNINENKRNEGFLRYFLFLTLLKKLNIFLK